MHEERWWNIIQRKFKTLVLFIMTQKSCKSLRYEPCWASPSPPAASCASSSASLSRANIWSRICNETLTDICLSCCIYCQLNQTLKILEFVKYFKHLCLFLLFVKIFKHIFTYPPAPWASTKGIGVINHPIKIKISLNWSMLKMPY